MAEYIVIMGDKGVEINFKCDLQTQACDHKKQIFENSPYIQDVLKKSINTQSIEGKLKEIQQYVDEKNLHLDDIVFTALDGIIQAKWTNVNQSDNKEIGRKIVSQYIHYFFSLHACIEHIQNECQIIKNSILEDPIYIKKQEEELLKLFDEKPIQKASPSKKSGKNKGKKSTQQDVVPKAVVEQKNTVETSAPKEKPAHDAAL